MGKLFFQSYSQVNHAKLKEIRLHVELIIQKMKKQFVNLVL